jgi:predicted nicotinamide N-methyase
MKLTEFKKLIKEAIEEEKKEATMEMMEPIDEIGTFVIVKKPKRGMTMEDMLQEVSIYDSIMKEEIIMATTNKPAARKCAKEALKEYEIAKKALQQEMEDYREAKKAIEEKKKKAKETIMRLK